MKLRVNLTKCDLIPNPFFSRGARAALTLAALMPLAACGGGAPPATLEPYRAPLRSGQTYDVTQAYGALRVQAGTFDAESSVRPWSSWWFPLWDDFLFKDASRDNPSLMTRYDQYVRKTKNKASNAQQAESELYDPRAQGWEGLCHAWAVASLLEPEPLFPRTIAGIPFSVGDLKGLVLKKYARVSGTVKFGQRFDSSRIDSDRNDIYPDQFHRFVQAELFEKGRPFIMDKDPTDAVWNTPVWKVSFEIQPHASDPHRVQVTAYVTGSDPWLKPDLYNRVGAAPLTKIYTYDLLGSWASDGAFEVQGGEWTGASLMDHPDFVTHVPLKVEHSSDNRELDPAIIAEILGRP